ncbi:PadR family transcriptional regulator, partial [Streptomyces sp. NPDC059802]
MEPGDSTKQARAAAQLRKGVLEYCVLALMRDRPRYGVELLHALEESGALAT